VILVFNPERAFVKEAGFDGKFGIGVEIVVV
jgi:hypothetical protein